MSDFLLEEVQEGGGQTPPPSAELTDITKLNATDWRGVRWSKISDSTDSKDGGKAYKVDDAMNQNINTTLTLKPKNNYKLTFNWKALANDKGLAYLMRTTVYSAKSGNHALPATSESDSKWGSECNYKFESWNDYTPIYVPNSPYSNLVTSSSMPNASADAADSALTSWNTCTVEFTTTDDLEYYLFLNFGLKGTNGKQAVIVSDFVLEDLGGASEDDANNLAASYSNANGHVTWTDNAGTHFVDNTSSIEGGYSWGFGMPNSSFNGEGGLEPVYIYITTDALEAGKNYEFSFIYEKDFIIDYYSIDQGAEVYKGPDDVKLLEGDRAHRVTVRFTAKKDGVHKITLKTGKGHNNQNCGWDKVILCDLKLYDITNRVDCSVEAELGGTVSGWDDIYCTKGKKVTLVATPLTGNTFEGWYDENGDLVSSEATYSFTVEKDFHLTAKFKGKNIPNVEWLTEHDMDGTFENGTMMGWVAEDRDNGDDSGWAYYNRSDEKPYNGSYSMKVRARHRTSVFHFDNLKKGTNYVLSFYVNFPADYIDMVDGEPVQSGDLAHIRYFGLEAGGASLYSETGPVIKAGAGWYKINLYFNTGDFNFVDWIYMYTQKTGSDQEFLYFDDISLTQYVSGEFENGTFETNTAPWRGDVVAENGVAKVAEGKKFYQNVNTGKNTLHKVTFKAKGKGIAGATQVTNDEPSILNALSSTSFVNIDSSDWKTYSFDVYSNVNPDISLFFKSTEGDLLVDDITVTKDGSVGDAVVENIDFETERFALHEQSDVYEIYNGTKGDANVHSGSKSLLFKAANAAKGEEYILQDAFTSYQISAKVNYKITFYYKTAKGNTLYLSPKYLPTDEDAIKTTYTAAGNGWTKVEFFYSNITATYVKAIFSNIANKTNADFYVDDISITIAPPMVIETNSANKYCEWPLNILNNEGFEKELTDKDWPNLPKTIKLRTDKGANGENYLRVNAKTHYVLAVQVDKGESYYFSVSTRLGKGASGYVAVTTDAAGTKLYNDSEGVPSSKITGNSNGWGRQAILFTPRDDGLVYIVLAADSGYIDVDDIYLYKKQYGKDYDPNDHTTFVPYNFDNPDPATVVLNGGDPTFGGNEITEEDVDSPSTGDNRVAPAIILFVSTFAALGLLATKKKTKKNTEGGNA